MRANTIRHRPVTATCMIEDGWSASHGVINATISEYLAAQDPCSHRPAGQRRPPPRAPAALGHLIFIANRVRSFKIDKDEVRIV